MARSMIRDELRYAVWLDPAPETTQVIAPVMEAMRERTGGPAFPPHLTCTSGISGDEADLMTRFRGLVAGGAACTLTTCGMLITDAYFRAVILPTTIDPALAALRARVREHFGLDPAAAWQPHLSLCYGSFDEATAASLRSAWAGHDWPPIVVGGCSLWRLRGPVADWALVDAVQW